jgi:pimeloyl-ACP methyl ester carboxylesterase
MAGCTPAGKRIDAGAATKSDRRRSGWVVAVLAVIVGLVTGIAPVSAQDVSPSDDFYAVPDPLPEQPPGTIIRTEPISAPRGMQAWKVLYHSRSATGRDIAVSGVVVAPTTPAGKKARTVFASNHGTVGLADACAPSRQADPLAGILYLDDAIAAGYVVTASDYEGLGTPGPHPYLVGASAAHSVLDGVRAARNLEDTHAGKDLIVFGHSQGGHAALFTGEIAKDYAPEINLRGVAAAAPGSRLEEQIPEAAANPRRAGLALLVTKGFEGAYPQADPASVLAPPVLAQSALVEQRCVTEVVKAVSRVPNPFTGFGVAPWPELLRENAAGNRAAGAPLLIAQGDQDVIALKAFTDDYVAVACGNGAVVDYQTYPGATHGGVVKATRGYVLDWLADRVKGVKAKGNCAS